MTRFMTRSPLSVANEVPGYLVVLHDMSAAMLPVGK